jgi:cobalt-zinc-cadmium efflux system protein
MALGISVAILLVELVAGIAANSLALPADAGHVFADVSGIALALAAIWIANRPASSGRSYGLYRAEILAASANALLLLAVSLFVIGEGVQRLFTPPEVDAGLVVGVALVALAGNLVSVRLLAEGGRKSLTIRGSYLEALGDLLGAAAVLVAGLVILVTGLQQADAIASILIGIMILPRTWALLRDSMDVLLEATPKGVELEEVRRHILEFPGVRAVHDLHVWTITSGMNVVSAHVVLEREADPGALLDHLGECLSGDFDIDHSTFQLETPEHVPWERHAAQTQH